MTDQDFLSAAFQEHGDHLRAVAYRMLGSSSEADDALQDAWLRISRAGATDVRNMRGWLTTIVARVCLNRLRSRAAEQSVWIESDEMLPPSIVLLEPKSDPQEDAVLGDAVAMAMQVVLDSLTPPERVSFVLHDVFDLSFREVGSILDRSEDAARQLASRARRKVRNEQAADDEGIAASKAVLSAFRAAAREGDFNALLRVLDPDVVIRSNIRDRSGRPRTIRGAAKVARAALSYARFDEYAREAIVNGKPGFVLVRNGRVVVAADCEVENGRLVRVAFYVDPMNAASMGIE
jgi:RNA polymerase sigma factor (sigma-70 family)